MKGTILINPYDDYSVQRRKIARMQHEFESLGVQIDVVANDGFVAYIKDGDIRCDLQTDFVLYFDKDRIAARLLEKVGMRLFNRAEATEICDDKMLTHAVLSGHGIPMPDTVAGPLCYNPTATIDPEYISHAVETLGLPVVVKECHGSFGEQVYLCDTYRSLKEKLEEIKQRPYLLQHFERESSGRDMRVIVIGGKTVCGMLRSNCGDFRSNASLGSECVGTDIPPDIALMCEKAARIIGLDYCGVDVLLTNPPKLCETNSNAMFETMEEVTSFNVAKAYAEYIVGCVYKRG